MNFDEIIEQRGTNSYKWDGISSIYGVSQSEGIPMSVAEVDFQAPQCVISALQSKVDKGVFGYDLDYKQFCDSIKWWYQNRFKVELDNDWIIPTSNTMNAIAICVELYTQPGDGIIIFSPVYHHFASTVRQTGRKVIECPLKLDGSGYRLDFEAYEEYLDGTEKMVLFCSPHNPGGRVWTKSEWRVLQKFAQERDLMVISDEIHQDIVYSQHSQIPAVSLDEEFHTRLISVSSPNKTFNMAGQCIAYAIIPDEKIRLRFRDRIEALGILPNSLGITMATAAYSEEGSEWLNAMIPYLEKNRDIFNTAINESDNALAVPLEGTYLAWVQLHGEQKDTDALSQKIRQIAHVASNPGSRFGDAYSNYLRFCFAMRRSLVEEAVFRLKKIL